MDIKLKSGRKLKLREDLSLDERDELLDSIEYKYDSKGKVKHMILPKHSTITKWLRAGIDGDTSDDFLKDFTFDERSEVFGEMLPSLFVGEGKASD